VINPTFELTSVQKAKIEKQRYVLELCVKFVFEARPTFLLDIGNASA